MNLKSDSYIYTLSVISPLHIGTGEKLKQKEYIVFSDRLYVLDFPRLLNSKIDDINRFFDLLESSGNRLKLFEKDPPEEFCKYIIPCKYNPQEVSPHLKSIYCEPYISGSSIKGAIRTALLWNSLSSEDNLFIIKDKLERIFKKLSNRPDYERKKLVTNLASDMSGETEVCIFESGYGYSPFRLLQISDTGPVNNNFLEISEVKVISLNLRGGINLKRFSLYPETIKGISNYSEGFLNNSVKLEGTLKIDKTLVREGGLQKEELQDRKDIIGNFISLCRNFSMERIKKEIFFFRECGLIEIARWYESLLSVDLRENQFFLQLGWGTGFESKTVTTYLPPEYLDELRYYFRLGKKKFRIHSECNSEVSPSFRKKGFYFCPTCRLDQIGPEDTIAVPFPKSRKIVFSGDKPFCPPGWVLFTLEEKKKGL